jgi:hypothetical protein
MTRDLVNADLMPRVCKIKVASVVRHADLRAWDK